MARTVITARVTLHRLSGSYKGYTIVSGLHPLFRLGSSISSGRSELIDVKALHPGEEAMAIIDYMEGVDTADTISLGSELIMQDGAEVIGVAVVCEMLTV